MLSPSRPKDDGSKDEHGCCEAVLNYSAFRQYVKDQEKENIMTSRWSSPSRQKNKKAQESRYEHLSSILAEGIDPFLEEEHLPILRLVYMFNALSVVSSLYMDSMDTVRRLGRGRLMMSIGYVTSFLQTSHMRESSLGATIPMPIVLPRSVLNISTTMQEPWSQISVSRGG